MGGDLLQQLDHAESKIARQNFRLGVPAHFMLRSRSQPLSPRLDFDIDFLLDEPLRPDEQVEQERQGRDQVKNMGQGLGKGRKYRKRCWWVDRAREGCVCAGRNWLRL